MPIRYTSRVYISGIFEVNPLVSIITPVYKTPQGLLRRFLSSALSQTVSEIELIAIDDASPDKCPRILDETAAGDSRMHVIHRNVNGRAGMARNNGLDLARGRYVFFADADDFMKPDMCEVLTDIADRHGADIVRCSFTRSAPEGKDLEIYKLSDGFLNLKLPGHRARAYNDMTFALWDKLFRRSVIDSIRFEQYEVNIGEDTLFNVAALCRSRKMATTSYVGYGYTVHPTSVTGRAVKGRSYLTTLIDSGKRIREVLEQEDQTLVGRRFADLMDLKRFATGCGWIAENADSVQKDELWKYWRRYFENDVLPHISSRKMLANWTKVVASFLPPHRAYPMIWGGCRAADPMGFVNRLKNRIN